jgi:hydroxypyruvate isomerase
MPRLSANLGFLWPGLPLLDRIDAAGRAGFEAIELHWPYDVPAEAVKAACARNRLKLLGLNTAVGNPGEFGLGALPGREADFQSAISDAIAYCLASGATSIHAMAGVPPPDRRAAARATFQRNLEVASAKAARHGFTLLLEPINPRDRPDYFYSRVDEAASIIGELDAANVKLMFDIYHVGVSEGDILKKLERHLPIVGHIQIAAVPSRAEPDEGEVAYDRVLRAIDRFGYRGWVGCEYKPRADTDAGLRWIEAMGLR